jgi:hypothetical protein
MNNASKLAVLADMIDELNDHADSYVSSLSVREDYGYNVPLHFFKVHATHKLAVYDEYGGEVGQCNKFVDCLVCDTKKMCALPASHEGPCEVKRR